MRPLKHRRGTSYLGMLKAARISASLLWVSCSDRLYWTTFYVCLIGACDLSNLSLQSSTVNNERPRNISVVLTGCLRGWANVVGQESRVKKRTGYTSHIYSRKLGLNTRITSLLILYVKGLIHTGM